MPVTIYVRKSWFDQGTAFSVYNIIKNTLFSSTFIASWFISSTIGAVFILSLIATKHNTRLLMSLFLVIYIICCLRSSYFSVFEQISAIQTFVKWYEIILVNPVYSFPAALLWVMIGKVFADGNLRFNRRVYFCITVISAALLYAEWRVVIKINGSYSNDCYFFLVPLVFSAFAIVKDSDIHISNAKKLRKMSTITYPMHASAATLISHVTGERIADPELAGLLVFLLTICCCHFTCFLIFRLEKNKKLSFLRYAH